MAATATIKAPKGDSFAKVIEHSRFAGAIGTAVLALMSAKFGWGLGHSWDDQFLLAILFALCSGIVGYGLLAVRWSHRNKRWGMFAIATSVFVFACVGEFVSSLGFVGSRRAATSDEAKMSNASYASGQKQNAAAQAKVDALLARIATPIRTAAEAQADIESTKAHKWWLGTTEQCTKTVGPDTRAYCAKYQAAVAGVAAAAQRTKDEAELKIAEAELGKVGADTGKRRMATSNGDAQGRVIASLATLSTEPTDAAQYWANVGLAVFIAIIALCVGFTNMLTHEIHLSITDSEARAPGAQAPVTAAPMAPTAGPDMQARKVLHGIFGAANQQRAA